MIIREGVEINQNVAFQTDGQSVDVDAVIEMEMINVAGVITLQADAENVVEGIKQRNSAEVFSPVGNRAGTAGLGGSVLIQSIDNTAQAIVSDNVRIHTSARGALSVTATQDVFSFDFAQSGGEAGRLGVSGSVSVVDGDNRTVAYIHDGATIIGGGVNVEAEDNTHRIAFVGAIQSGGGIGIGASVGVQTIDRDTQAILGNRRFDVSADQINLGNNQATLAGHSLVEGDRVFFEAVDSGSIGGLTSGQTYFVSNVDGDAVELSATDDGATIDLTSSSGEFRFERRTSVVFNNPTVSTGANQLTIANHGLKTGDALHYTSGSTPIGGLTDGKTYFVVSTDANTIELRETPDASSSVGLTSAGVGTQIFERVLSIIDAGQGIQVAATTSGRLWTLGVAGARVSNTARGNGSTTSSSAGNSSGGTGGGAGGSGGTPTRSGVGIAGDATWNDVTSLAEAYINSDGWLRTSLTSDITATADDSTSIVSISGAIAVVTTGRNTIGLAGSFSRNILDLSTVSFIDGVEVDRSRDVKASSTRTGNLFALSAAVAATRSTNAASRTGVGASLAGSLSWNTIDGVTSSTIEDVDIANSRDVTATALDTSSILSIGGGAGITVTGQLGVGAGVGINEITGGVFSRLVDSKIRVTGNVEAKAENSVSIHGIGFSAGAGILGIAGTVGINELDVDSSAVISGSDIVATTPGGATSGSVKALATDNATIRSDAGALAIGILSLIHI